MLIEQGAKSIHYKGFHSNSNRIKAMLGNVIMYFNTTTTKSYFVTFLQNFPFLSKFNKLFYNIFPTLLLQLWCKMWDTTLSMSPICRWSFEDFTNTLYFTKIYHTQR